MVPEWPVNLTNDISNPVSGQTMMWMDLYQVLGDTYWQHAMADCMSYEEWCHHILNAILTRMMKHSKYWWVNPLVVSRHMRANPSLIQQQLNLHNERSVAINCHMQSLQQCQSIQNIGECIHLLYLDQNMGECIHLLYLDGIEQIQSIIEKQTKLYYC